MRAIIDNNGEIKPIDDRDSALLFLTQQVDLYLTERKKDSLFYDIGIMEKCILAGFVMWLVDNKKLK